MMGGFLRRPLERAVEEVGEKLPRAKEFFCVAPGETLFVLGPVSVSTEP